MMRELSVVSLVIVIYKVLVELKQSEGSLDGDILHLGKSKTSLLVSLLTELVLVFLHAHILNDVVLAFVMDALQLEDSDLVLMMSKLHVHEDIYDGLDIQPC